MRRLLAAACLAAMMAPPAAAQAAVGPCPGAAEPSGARHVFTGTFDASKEGSYVLVPFAVPAGMTRVRVKLCHDQSQSSQIPLPSPLDGAFKHTLDLGVYGPSADEFYDGDEFRGWGGSSRLNALLTPEDRDTASEGAPRRTTVGFIPGAISPGTWAAEIGVAAVVEPHEGEPDGAVEWRLEVYYESFAADTDNPWQPATYDETPAQAGPGWYKGDFHVHMIHSNPTDVEMVPGLDYSFGSRADGGAGLDFVTLSDYVTTRHWDEIGGFQDDHLGKLIVRSAEVITYRGHVNNHASGTWADYRTGPVYERQAGGGLVEVRAPFAPGAADGIFDQVHASGTGWTQVNHPTTFSAKVPGLGNLCRGCSWEHTDAETDWSKVDAMEVQTGPAGTPDKIHPSQPGNLDGRLGPNPFTPLAIEWWDRLRRDGHDITAVGSSDSHKGNTQNLTQSPIGEATTVVYAGALSEQGIRDGVVAGHAYIKFFGSDGPGLDLRARELSLYGGDEVMMGDELSALAAQFTAKALAPDPTTYPKYPEPYTLHVYYQGVPWLAAPVVFDSDGEFELSFVGAAPGDYRLQLQRGSAIEALSNPITLVSPVAGGS